LFEQDRRVRDIALKTPAGFLAFGFGSGLLRHAPGTMGTMVAIPFALVLRSLPAPVYWSLLGLFFMAGVYLCGIVERKLGQHDPGGIVWDEMLAYWLCVAFIPVEWVWLLAAFALFRLFDIVKPWPIRKAERLFGGGFGIMLDDVIAAVYAMAALALVKIMTGL
jgi:phosphatidylglycerophosphatase A